MVQKRPYEPIVESQPAERGLTEEALSYLLVFAFEKHSDVNDYL